MTIREGTRVEIEIAGEVFRGVARFVDAGWVHWTDDAGCRHASPASSLCVVTDDVRHDAIPNTHRTVSTRPGAIDNGNIDTNDRTNGQADDSR